MPETERFTGFLDARIRLTTSRIPAVTASSGNYSLALRFAAPICSSGDVPTRRDRSNHVSYPSLSLEVVP